MKRSIIYTHETLDYLWYNAFFNALTSGMEEVRLFQLHYSENAYTIPDETEESIKNNLKNLIDTGFHSEMSEDVQKQWETFFNNNFS